MSNYKKIQLLLKSMLAVILVVVILFGFITEDQVILTAIAKATGSLILVLFLYWITAGRITYASKYIEYLTDNINIDLTEKEKKKLVKGVQKIYEKDFQGSIELFTLYSDVRFSDFFISMINIEKGCNLNASIDVLERYIENRQVKERFGDFYYLLAKAYKNIDSGKSNVYTKSLCKKDLFLFKKRPV